MPAKYQILARLLREDIAIHCNTANYRLPTEQALTEKYHVSRQTVRHALQLLCEDGLIQKRQGSGAYATGLHAASSMEIAVIATFMDDYIFPAVLRDIETVLEQKGYHIRVYITRNRIAEERRILQALAEKPCAGILAEGSKTALPNPNTDLYRKLRDMHIPIVFFQGSYAELPDIPAVMDDNYGGGVQLANHLIGQGHTRIGGIFKSDDIQGIQRYSGVMSALRDAGLPLPDQEICWFDTQQHSALVEQRHRQMLTAFLSERLRNVSAIICYNDEIAYHLIQVLLSQGKKVPEDYAVVSFDNSYYSQICPVPITSVCHRQNRMGREAALLLLRLLQGSTCRSTSLAWELMVRASG